MKSIDIHGLYKSEAQIEIELFLKESFEHRQYFILIIHGYGKDVLRELTHNVCSTSKYVEKFEPAPPNLGGGGATLVYLKKKGLNA